MKRLVLYSAYERLWHWLQAAAILALLLTGLAIHRPDVLPLPLAPAVSVHELLGFLLLGNATLGLFYHLMTGAIRQYLPEPRDLVTLSIKQARYYLSGIFRDAPHPFERSPARKLNPLQQLTYLAILNLLLPAQILTGTAMWAAQRWPGSLEPVGGLPLLAPIHTLCAWLFAAFVVAHVYLTTTGPTPLAHIQAMIVGWEEVPDDAD